MAALHPPARNTALFAFVAELRHKFKHARRVMGREASAETAVNQMSDAFYDQCTSSDEFAASSHADSLMSDISDDSLKSTDCNNSVPAYKKKQDAALCIAYAALFRMQYKSTYWEECIDEAKERLPGCRHYARNCKIYANCCNVWVPCRQCHDEALGDDHRLDRHATSHVICTQCHTEQRVSASCIACKTQFAHHFCNICKFYENTPHRRVYHCDKCGICRRGRGLGIDNFHCDRCDACVTMETKEQHNCLEKCLHAECPVCLEFMFTSTTPVFYMRCGHPMHETCFREYAKTSYQCPYCAKSVSKMTDYFACMDSLLEGAESKKKSSHVLCNDCGNRSVVPYHLIYHRCGAGNGCTSYNTRVLRMIDPPQKEAG